MAIYLTRHEIKKPETILEGNLKVLLHLGLLSSAAGLQDTVFIHIRIAFVLHWFELRVVKIK